MPKQLLEVLNAEDSTDFFVKVGFYVLAILGPLYNLMGGLVLLVLIDIITGVAASRKKKEPISFIKLGNSLIKIVYYGLIIMASWIVEDKFISAIPFMRLVSGFLALNELKSILYNFRVIANVDLWDLIRSAINRKDISDLVQKTRTKKPSENELE